MSLVIEHLQNAFQWTWQTSAQASIFVGLILLLLFFWGPRLSPRWRMVLGLLILMRLVIPVLPESSLSYLNLIPKDRPPVADTPRQLTTSIVFTAPKKTIQAYRIDYSRPVVYNDASPAHLTIFRAMADNPVIAPTSNSIIFATGPSTSEPFFRNLSLRSYNVSELFTPKLISVGGTTIWLLGMLFLIFSTLYRRRRLCKKIKGHTRLPDNSAPTIILDICRHKMGIERKIYLIPCHHIQTAAVLGFLRPVILVSPQLEQKFTQNEIRDILLHELAHIQRADILWNWLAFAAQTLRWFNPLTWVATHRFRADRELACDARVLKYLPPDEHSHYGSTLIKIATLHSGNHLELNPALAPFNHHKSEIKTRITMIANPNKITKLSHVMLTLTLVIICSVAFTRAQDDERKRDEKREVDKERKEIRRVKAIKRDVDRDSINPERAQRVKVVERDGDRDRPKVERDKYQRKKAVTKRDGDRDNQHPVRVKKRGDQPEHGRPPHPPEARGPKDAPPHAQEFAERVRKLHKEIAHLSRDGKQEQSRQVQEELKEFIKNHHPSDRRIGAGPPERSQGSERGRGSDHRPPSPEAEVEMKRIWGELLQAKKEGRQEEAVKLYRRLEDIKQHHARRGDHPEGETREMARREQDERNGRHREEDERHHVGRRDHPEGEWHEYERRIRHLHQAAENLEKAGLDDAAREIHEQAENMERELHQQREREEDQQRGERDELLERELHEQAKEMDREMRNQAEQMDREMRKQAEQMDKELRELSNVIERLEKENEYLKKALKKRAEGE